MVAVIDGKFIKMISYEGPAACDFVNELKYIYSLLLMFDAYLN